MTRHAFGGLWTAQKLAVLAKYLEFFTTAMSGQRFKLVYIDTFAGTGKCTIKVSGGVQTIDGSARIALDVTRPFDEYLFIELRPKHVKALRALAAEHDAGGRVSILQGDAREHLAEALRGHDWTATRGVLFLDPYGLQCTWRMVEQIAATRALDVFFLVSLSGLARQAARSASKIDEDKAAALDRFLGTKGWRDALYSPPAQGDFFVAVPDPERAQGGDAITQFVTGRLRQVFPHVEEPVILRTTSGAPLYALYFAVSNPSQRAIDLAGRVGRDVLSKLR